MIGWRITRKPYADLSGQGGLHASGRWHKRGQPILYMADHPALAMLEVRVHLDLPPQLLPDDYVLMRVEWPDDLTCADLSKEALKALKATSEFTFQDIGQGWLMAQKTSLAKVPSLLVPHCHNYLLNPVHSESESVKILSCEPVSFDQRLFAEKSQGA